MERIDLSERRAAQNHELFGDVGDELRVLSERVDGELAIAEFVCECVDIGCSDRIALTIAEYEAVREVPARFAVKPGHVHFDHDDVVSEHDQFTVVEKRDASVDLQSS